MNSHQRTLIASLGFADVDKKEPRHDLAGQYLSQPEVIRSLIEALTVEQFDRGLWAADIQKIKVKPEHHITRGNYTVGFADLWVSYSAIPRRYSAMERAHEIDELASAQLKRRETERNKAMADAFLAETGKPFHEHYSNREANWRQQYKQDHRFDQLAAEDVAEAKQWIVAAKSAQPLPEWDELRQEWVERVWGPSYKGQSYGLLVEVKIHPIPIGDMMRQMALYDQHIFPAVSENYPPRLVLATAFDLSQIDVDTLRLKSIQHIRLGAKFDAYCQQRSQSPQKSLSLEI